MITRVGSWAGCGGRRVRDDSGGDEAEIPNWTLAIRRSSAWLRVLYGRHFDDEDLVLDGDAENRRNSRNQAAGVAGGVSDAASD